MTAVNDMIGRAAIRSGTALRVLLFGQPEARRTVERLVDGELDEDDAQAVRDWLDRLARRRTS